MDQPLYVTKHELARLRGIDVRSLNLPKAVARLLAGGRAIGLYPYPVDMLHAAVAVSYAARSL